MTDIGTDSKLKHIRGDAGLGVPEVAEALGVTVDELTYHEEHYDKHCPFCRRALLYCASNPYSKPIRVLDDNGAKKLAIGVVKGAAEEFHDALLLKMTSDDDEEVNLAQAEIDRKTKWFLETPWLEWLDCEPQATIDTITRQTIREAKFINSLKKL